MVLKNPLARRLFLHRHALAEPLSAPAPSLADLIDRLGFVQVDSINTVARAHHMILFSRQRAYDPQSLKTLLEGDRKLWEHWTHDASILPIRLHTHWRHRFDRDAERLRGNWKSWFRDGYEAQFETILRRIETDGPVTSSDVGQGEARGKGGWWDWHPSKTALEWLWRTGKLAISRRDGFQKVYDLTDRVIPAQHRSGSVDEAEMVDWACASAIDQLGFADAKQIRAYWQCLRADEVKHWVAQALRRGEIIEIELAGATGEVRRAYARPDTLSQAAALPEVAPQLRIMSPFDPALRDRDRAEFLFGFHYRIEVFVPEAKRLFGYYVFPILEGDRLIGRIDMKAFRDQAALRVRGLWPEKGVKFGVGRMKKLEAELARWAPFSGCDRVEFLDGWLRDA